MVTEGYKETEIGVIPEGWEVVHLDDITIKITSGGTPSRSKDEYFKNGTINWLKTGELRDCYIYGAKEKITEEAINNSSAKLFPIDTLLIAMYGATIGQTAYLKTECATNQACCAIIFDKELASPFFYWKYFYFIKDTLIALGRGAGQPNISQGIIKELKIPLPPLKEQEKIAGILSTADKKIDAIALQIQKAQTLKKGLLQKLLSEGIPNYGAGTLVPKREDKESWTKVQAPKRKFKDSELGKIPESWEVVKLNDLVKITMGQSPKSYTYNTDKIGMPLIQGNADCKNRKTIPRSYTTELTKECFVGDIIMTVRAPVGAISKSLHNACIGRGVCSIKPKEDNEYIYHCLVAYEDKWDKLSQGSTFTAVSGSDIKNLKFPLPPLKEQKQIADILSTADEKLEVLRAKKEKYETLKKGLLQKLLSGEVRV